MFPISRCYVPSFGCVRAGGSHKTPSRLPLINTQNFDSPLFCVSRSLESLRSKTPVSLMSESDDKARIQRLERDLLLIRAAFDGAGDAIKIGDMDGRSLYHNRAFKELLDYTEDQLIQAGGPAALFADRQLADEVFGSVAAGRSWVGEAVIRARGGRLLTTALRADQIKDEHLNPLGLIAVFTDLTETKAAEDRYRDLIENSGLLIGTHDLEGNILTCNQAFVHFAGYESAEDLPGRNLRDFLAHDAKRLFDQYLEDMLAQGRASGLMKIATPAGETRLLQYDNSLRREGLDAPLVRCFGNDVTAVKETERMLRKAWEFRDNVMQSVTNAVAVLNRDGRFTMVNRSASEISGYSAAELIGRDFSFLIDPARMPDVEEQVDKAIHHGVSVFGQETQIIRKDGERRLIRFSLMPLVENEAITGVVCTADDITEFVRLQQENIQFEKLAWLGHMIAGAAHELREPLNNIMGYAEWLKDHETDEQARSIEDVIMAEGGRAAGIVSDLLAFARRERLHREQVDINEILDRVLRARSGELAAAGLLVVRDMDPLPGVLAEERLLERVFANIVANGEQAMAGQVGGMLTVRTRLKRDPDRVAVEIADTGPGIALEHLPRVFDPFFTTKRNTQGLGLGLSFSYGVIGMHGGEIRVESEPGAGACFTVELPVDAETRPL